MRFTVPFRAYRALGLGIDVRQSIVCTCKELSHSKALCACRLQHHLDGPGACPASSAGMRALLALLLSSVRVFTAGCPLFCNAIQFACRRLQRNYEKNLSPSALRGKLERFAAVCTISPELAIALWNVAMRTISILPAPRSHEQPALRQCWRDRGAASRLGQARTAAGRGRSLGLHTCGRYRDTA